MAFYLILDYLLYFLIKNTNRGVGYGLEVPCEYHFEGDNFWKKMKNSSPNQQSADRWSTAGRQLADRLSFTAFYENLLPTVGRLLAACR